MSDSSDRPVPVTRALQGGVLMGLANLVPGISGGTMILAIGLYDRFIEAVADVTRLRLRRSSLQFLLVMALGLGAAVVAFSGVAVLLVTEHRPVMYALFIGMTLGGAPELWKECRPPGLRTAAAILAGVLAMAGFASIGGSAPLQPTVPVLLMVGAAGASSMILPGISGSYVLLVLGMYDTVIGALSAGQLRESPAESLAIVVPVVLGAGLGIALLSNLLKALLRRFSAPSHGVLLGLLLGSVLGLYPFQQPVHPDLAERGMRKAIEAVVVEGAPPAEVALELEGVDAADLEARSAPWAGRSAGDLKREGLRLERFSPDARQVLSTLLLFALGVALTRRLGRSGRDA
ncbi:MAG: DUF368 domain-containing protein [Planctomycetota bacterium]|jgi:putative membrane protein